ncbi:hypothetical protein H5410_015944 [Solanum commersonii]|uniref:Ubiquitin-like protease family profile domain-containing protein n=1 Tax=Solanum commersonii TaxID=4109 RepID=A0A9J5ZV89_SOLCO|nr:hypothetical protein H5410_015944 [Solanum commersonii]
MTYNIDVHTSKKISQPLKCMRLKQSIYQTLSIISERKKSVTTVPVSHSNPKVKEKDKEKEKEEEKEKEKERRRRRRRRRRKDKEDHYLANCSDLEFKQLDFVVAFSKKKDWFYVMSQPNKCWTDQKKSKQQSHSKYRYTTTNYFFKIYIDNSSVVFEYRIKSLALSKGLVYLVDCLGTSSRTKRKLCFKIQKLSTLLPKYLEFFFYQKDQTNWSVLESYQEKNKSHPFKVRHVTGIAQQASNSIDCGLFVAAYAEFLSDGLQVLSYGIISETLRMRYVSLLWNYGILKARSGSVSSNEDPQRPRPKKAKFDENVVVTTIY